MRPSFRSPILTLACGSVQVGVQPGAGAQQQGHPYRARSSRCARKPNPRRAESLPRTTASCWGSPAIGPAPRPCRSAWRRSAPGGWPPRSGLRAGAPAPGSAPASRWVAMLCESISRLIATTGSSSSMSAVSAAWNSRKDANSSTPSSSSRGHERPGDSLNRRGCSHAGGNPQVVGRQIGQGGRTCGRSRTGLPTPRPMRSDSRSVRRVQSRKCDAPKLVPVSSGR